MDMAEILDQNAVRYTAGASSKKRLLQDISDHAEVHITLNRTKFLLLCKHAKTLAPRALAVVSQSHMHVLKR